MVWAFVSCLLQVLTSDSSFPFGLTRLDVLKRLMLLDEFARTQEDLRRPLRSEEQATRAQLGEWVQRFERWVNSARS